MIPFIHGAVGVSPLPVTGAALWLDATVTSSITYGTGSNVSQWNDLSGNGRHFSQATTTKQPIHTASMQNGLYGMKMFSTTQRSMTCSGYTFQNSAFTVLAVVNFKKGTASFPAIIGQDGTSFLQVGGDQYGDNYAYSRIGQATYTSNRAVTSGNADCVVYKSAGVNTGTGAISISFYNNGTTGDTVNGTSFGTAPTLAAIGGSANGTGDYFGADGYLCELLVYPSQLSDGDRGLLETYLKDKWGTP